MYSGVGDVRQWVLPLALHEHAECRGDQQFVSVIGDGSLTFGELRDQVEQVAHYLSELGGMGGDRIAILVPNGLDFLRAWAGVGRMGGIAVLLNSELTGAFLAHPLVDSQPRILIIHADFLSRLDEFADRLKTIEHIVVVGDTNGLDPGSYPFEGWQAAPRTTLPMPTAQDIACIIYTSGTTGAPKGVLMPHAHCFLFGLGVIENLGLTEHDHYYTCLPLFHANGLLMQVASAMIAGGRVTIRDRFSASAWLNDIRESQATVTHSLGALSAFVIAQPPSKGDRDHRLRLIMSAPNPPEHEMVWRDRFGIPDVLSAYGMTEVNIPIYGVRGRSRPGSCGLPYARYFEVEIRDPDTDHPVPSGEVGEIMVRPRIEHCFMAGYFGLPHKTLEAWRNFWFHTGDAGRMDADGYVTFIDRIKDCIRRRGENISATDIEAAFTGLDGVKEVAAFAIPSEHVGGEDEIMLAIVLNEGATLTATDIALYARGKMPRFAQPRYIEFKADLPKTVTEKVKKSELRAAGRGSDTIDLALLEATDV